MFGKKKQPEELAILGWREWVAFPDLGVWAIKAKVDSGARTSTLHVEDTIEFEREGKNWIKFRVYPRQKSLTPEIVAEAEVIGHKHIKSSSGHVTERPVIRTTLQTREQIYKIELSLADRDQMGFRLLIGRTALKNRYLIDPARSYLGGIYPEVKK